MLFCGHSLQPSCSTSHSAEPCSALSIRNSRLPFRTSSWQQIPHSQSSRSLCHRHAFQRQHRQSKHGIRNVVTCSLQDTLLGVGLFFTPSLLALAYATVKGKGNTKDGLSRMLTELSQGYFQPNVGGETIPVAQGELSDLAGDEPLFKALYQWWASGYMHAQPIFSMTIPDHSILCLKVPWIFRFLDSGGVYKLAFGPKAFIVVSDPVVVRHLLKVCPPTSQPAKTLAMHFACHVKCNSRVCCSSSQCCRS